MTEAAQKPHLSATQMELYSKCPEAYRRRYIEGEKIPPGVAMLKGTGLHRGAETNFRQKIESHRDLPTSDIVDAAVAAFEGELARGFQLDKDEESIGAENVIGDAKDDVADMAEFHAKKQAPDYQPVRVEETVRIELPGPRDLLAVIDLGDDQGRVVDFKTAKKSKGQGDADDSVQLTVYAAAHQALTGEPPALVRLDTIVQTSKETKRQILDSTRGPADIESLAHRINSISAAVDAGVFPPTTPGAWWCGSKWCGYHATCRFVVKRD